MTGVALQGVLCGLNHVRGRPVHPGFGEAILTGKLQAGILRAERERGGPVEGLPETAATVPASACARLEQIVVDCVIGLFGNVQFEGEDPGFRVLDVASREVDVGGFQRIYFVAQQVAIGQVAIEPKIDGGVILFVDEGAFDLQIGVMILGLILPGSGPVPRDFGRVFQRDVGDVAGLAGDRVGVQVEARVGVGLRGVTVFAGRLLAWVNRVVVRHHAAFDYVVFRAVAIGAEEVFAPHVNVQVFRREV